MFEPQDDEKEVLSGLALFAHGKIFKDPKKKPVLPTDFKF